MRGELPDITIGKSTTGSYLWIDAGTANNNAFRIGGYADAGGWNQRRFNTVSFYTSYFDIDTTEQASSTIELDTHVFTLDATTVTITASTTHYGDFDVDGNITVQAGHSITLPDGTVDTDQLADSAVETAKINNDAVTYNKIDRASGSSTGTGSNAIVYIAMQSYTFFPSVYNAFAGTFRYTNVATANGTGRFAVYGQNTYAYGVYWNYITATDKPFIFALRDENGIIVAVWECDDPPPECWGLSEKPDGFTAPISTDGSEFDDLDEIVLFNYNMDEFKDLRSRARIDKTKGMCGLFNKEYEFDSDKKLFVRKNLSMM